MKCSSDDGVGPKLGQIIAHWNLEHTDEERKAHLDWLTGFLKQTGLDRFMYPRMADPEELWTLGWPKTRIDLKLRKRYLGRVYRHRRTGSRITRLSVIRLCFAHQAGVYSYDKAMKVVHPMTGMCRGPADAARISAWDGWEGASCDYSLMTDAREYCYRCRLFSGYDGNAGDSFGYGRNWADVHAALGNVICKMVDDLGLRYVKD